MGCCGSSEQDENRPLLRENGARSRSGSQRDSRRVNGNDRMVAGINYHKENINGDLPAVPRAQETGNYDQRALDYIVQTAIKDFIDISQTSEPPTGGYENSHEKTEVYLAKIRTMSIAEFKGSLLPDLSGHLIAERPTSTEESQQLDTIVSKLAGAFNSIAVEDKGSLLVGFSSSSMSFGLKL